MLFLTKSKGHKSNSPYSGFPNHLQTKSNLHISICQSQILCIKSRWGTPYIHITSVSVVEFHDGALGIGKVFGQESTVVK